MKMPCLRVTQPNERPTRSGADVSTSAANEPYDQEPPLPSDAHHTYWVSVVVPAYNCADSIAATVESLLAQTIGRDKLEIILVNDGSTDTTLGTCSALAAQTSNIVVIDKPNGGVGSARNAGIEAARGTYIAFLDGDDTLLPETLEAAVTFFNAHRSEVDLVAYPMTLFNEQREWHHAREKVLTETGVYDLTKLQYAFSLITNVNVLVKNDAALPRFREDLRVHEDEVFFMQVLLEKQTVGFSKAGGYRYYQHPGSAISTKMHPFYQFEKNIGFWEELFERYTCSGTVKAPLYLQASYLNEVNWKIRQDVFFPYHYDAERFAEALERVAALMAYVDDDVIFTSPRADEFYRHYLLGLKANSRIECTVADGGFTLWDASLRENAELGNNSHDNGSRHPGEIPNSGDNAGTFLLCRRFAVAEVLKTRLTDDGLQVEGVVRSLVLEHAPQARLGFAAGDGPARYAEFEPTSYDYRTGRTRTNRFGKFRALVPTNASGDISFWVDVDGARLPLRLSFSNRVNFNPDAGITSFSRANVLVSLEKGSLHIQTDISRAAVFGVWMKNTRRASKLDSKSLKRRLYAALRKPTQETWLYYDAPAEGFTGNAFCQFLHDVQQNDGIQRFYVTHGNVAQLRSTLAPEPARHIMTFKSKDHRYLHLNASKIVTSSLDHAHWCPFSKKNMQGLADIAQYELVYLPGETNAAHEPWKRAEDRLLVDRITAASPWEKATLLGVYGFTESQIIQGGKPCFDMIGYTKNNSADDSAAPISTVSEQPSRRILFAPTWRSYLVTKLLKNEFDARASTFKASRYWNETKALLQSPDLAAMLQRRNCTLDVALPPQFEVYRTLFTDLPSSAKSDRIRFLAAGEASLTVAAQHTELRGLTHLPRIRNYQALITDFSPYMFDFAYLERPVLFFLPDAEEWKVGLHEFRKLDLPFKDGFGSLCAKADQLLSILERLAEQSFEPEAPYAQRIHDFYPQRDTNNRNRIYRALAKA